MTFGFWTALLLICGSGALIFVALCVLVVERHFRRERKQRAKFHDLWG